MKLKVQVRTQPETQQGALYALQLAVGPQDTARTVKERIAAVEPVPFPDQDLLLDGRVLGDDVRLADCAVEDGSSLDLIVKASEEVFAQQLSELLQARAISPEELGLLYTHRHGVGATGALKVLGRKEPLLDFLRHHESFVVENGLVSYVSKSAARKPAQAAGALSKIPEDGPLCGSSAEAAGDSRSKSRFPVRVSVVLQAPSAPDETSSLDLDVHGTDTVLGLKERVSAAELMPFPDRKLFLGGGELHDEQRLEDCGVKGGSSLDFVVTASEEGFAQQLAELLQAQALSVNDLSLLYSYRHGTAVPRVLKVLGRGERLPGFLDRLPHFSLQSGCVRLASKAAQQSQRYADLHREICSAAFGEKVSTALQRTVATLLRVGCLNVQRAVQAGSVGRSTAVPGTDDAEVVLFVEGLPPTGHERWLPGLLSAMAATLQAQLTSLDHIEAVHASADSVQVRCLDNFTVNIFIAPVFGSYREVIDTLGACPYSAVALAEERTHFIDKLSKSAKMAMRLLKWWCSRQPWSTPEARPSNWLLELVVAHVAMQLQSPELSEILEGVWALLTEFDRASIVWPLGSACYDDSEVPEALLRQRPLLLDPTNPLVNVADCQAFNATEIMAFAKSPDF